MCRRTPSCPEQRREADMKEWMRLLLRPKAAPRTTNTRMLVEQLKHPISINVNGLMQALILGATLPSLQTQELFLGKHYQRNMDNVNSAGAVFQYKSGAYFRGRLFLSNSGLGSLWPLQSRLFHYNFFSSTFQNLCFLTFT